MVIETIEAWFLTFLIYVHIYSWKRLLYDETAGARASLGPKKDSRPKSAEPRESLKPEDTRLRVVSGTKNLVVGLPQ